MKHRIGEPVIVTHELGNESLGTIEWGDVNSPYISVYCEAGGRCIIIKGADWPKLRTDPGGKRPVWARVSAR